jgi:hypothetical protein
MPDVQFVPTVPASFHWAIRRAYDIMRLKATEWRSILVSPPSLKAGLKIRQRAHRWSSWCWLSTPSRGLMLGVKVAGRSTMACGRGPRFRGGPCPWRKRKSAPMLRLGVWTCKCGSVIIRPLSRWIRDLCAA